MNLADFVFLLKKFLAVAGCLVLEIVEKKFSFIIGKIVKKEKVELSGFNLDFEVHFFCMQIELCLASVACSFVN